MILDVRDITHRVANLEIHLVRSVEDIIEYLLQFVIHLFTGVPHLCKQVAILLGLKAATCPGLAVEQVFVDIGLHNGVLHLW